MHRIRRRPRFAHAGGGGSPPLQASSSSPSSSLGWPPPFGCPPTVIFKGGIRPTVHAGEHDLMDLGILEWGTCNKKLIINVLHNMLSKDAFLKDDHNETQHMGSVPHSDSTVKKSSCAGPCSVARRIHMPRCTLFFTVLEE